MAKAELFSGLNGGGSQFTIDSPDPYARYVLATNSNLVSNNFNNQASSCKLFAGQSLGGQNEKNTLILFDGNNFDGNFANFNYITNGSSPARTIADLESFNHVTSSALIVKHPFPLNNPVSVKVPFPPPLTGTADIDLSDKLLLLWMKDFEPAIKSYVNDLLAGRGTIDEDLSFQFVINRPGLGWFSNKPLVKVRIPLSITLFDIDLNFFGGQSSTPVRKHPIVYLYLHFGIDFFFRITGGGWVNETYTIGYGRDIETVTRRVWKHVGHYVPGLSITLADAEVTNVGRIVKRQVENALPRIGTKFNDFTADINQHASFVSVYLMPGKAKRGFFGIGFSPIQNNPLEVGILETGLSGDYKASDDLDVQSKDCSVIFQVSEVV